MIIYVYMVIYIYIYIYILIFGRQCGLPFQIFGLSRPFVIQLMMGTDSGSAQRLPSDQGKVLGNSIPLH